MKKFIDNKSKWYGEVIPEKEIMRVNFKKSRNVPFTKTSPTGIAGIADSIVHEELHVKHQRMHEMKIRSLTKKILSNMDESKKKAIVNNYKKQAKQIKPEERKQFYGKEQGSQKKT